GSLHELRDECARTKAAVIDLEARRRRIHAERHLRSWVDADGAGHLHVTDNPERVAQLMAHIQTRRDELVAAARTAGGTVEALEAYAADALHDMLCGTPEPASDDDAGDTGNADE